ncbi:MAG: SDR family NAD(P)-dependent oxidoreductase [Proteobacteria bacterium]|nr:SDR family NAD(P)-dependent oxidoreductase [Pseudomonadota bacterium]
MKDFNGKVAVVTGAASGIGLALARALAGQGMKVVLADVEDEALRGAAETLAGEGAETLAVRTDVTVADDVSALAERTLDRFGAVHVICNNAGVFTGGLTWEAPLEDWEWVMGVNLLGVVHGIRTFVPILLEQDEGHVVNTASMAGVTSMPFTGVYCTSKHAVLALSESLYHELALRGAKVGVSALCPEEVATRIDRSERNRPDHLKRPADAPESAEGVVMQEAITQAVNRGTPPETIAARVLDAIRDERFYVLSDGAWRRACETRLEDIRLGRNPTFSPPVDTGS